MQASTIDEVINLLDTIIIQSKQTTSRIGYFATLYRKMTIAVKEGIQHNMFEDGARMEKLDVTFANRYLAAYSSFKQNEPTTSCWHIAFNAASTNKYTVIQHLLCGINAHINLDLGIAAAQISSGLDIHLLQNDFDKINHIISNMINNVQSDLEKIAFPMRLLRYVDNDDEQAVINFSIDLARQAAWNNALLLWNMDESGYDQYLKTLDEQVSVLADRILSPGFFLHLLMVFIRWVEPADVNANITYLSQ